MIKFHFRPCSTLFSAGLLAMLLSSCSCTDSSKSEAGKDKTHQTENKGVPLLAGAQSEKLGVQKAEATVRGYQSKDITGVVTFTKVPSGIEIVADVYGLNPGKHGFHVHEHGDCSGADGMKAGGHFNPAHTKHGGPDSAERHVGDFGNLEADEEGHARYERVDTFIAFEGVNSIIGKSIIIHADPDDLESQPTGNSGARIACGMIEVIEGNSK